MTDLMRSFSLPWWFWTALGGAVVAYVTHKGFHQGIDELVSYMLGLKARKKTSHRRDEEDGSDDEQDND